jgi:hypothetical protein|tara:strand:- start:125 stop:313 length:189 start_codon:yes stop_codon:yes gene_type:complete
MDEKNILSEGFFDLFKRIKSPKDMKLTSIEKKLYKKDPEFKKAVDTVFKNGKKIDQLIKQST